MKRQSLQNAVALKTKLRRKMSTLRFSVGIRASRSLKLSSKIERSSHFKNAAAIGFYAALPDEIEIAPAARKALELGKQVFFPRMQGAKIEFHEVSDLKNDLKPGKYGILEPTPKTKKRIRPLDLILIPGRAFDKNGGRLGRGIGYYDRLLEKWASSFRIGVAFREQIVRQIPQEPHDIKMHIVMTA